MKSNFQRGLCVLSLRPSITALCSVWKKKYNYFACSRDCGHVFFFISPETYVQYLSIESCL
jgi:hypothetical protein